MTEADESRLDTPAITSRCLDCGADVFYPALEQATDLERKRMVFDQFKRHVEWNPDIHKFNDGTLWIDKAVNP